MTTKSTTSVLCLPSFATEYELRILTDFPCLLVLTLPCEANNGSRTDAYLETHALLPSQNDVKRHQAFALHISATIDFVSLALAVVPPRSRYLEDFTSFWSRNYLALNPRNETLREAIVLCVVSHNFLLPPPPFTNLKVLNRHQTNSTCRQFN
jgi:hypothetical protein